MQTKPNDKIQTNMFPATRTNEEALGHGLSKREHFAAMVLPGIYHYYSRKDLAPISVEQAAMVARQAADALIAELNK